MLMILLSTVFAQGQIVIGGNVYGGGNEGEVGGSTSVTVRQGDIDKVFGGARMANVGGNSYVNVDGAQASGFVVINQVFGGNDIAGTIGTAEAVGKTTAPAEVASNTYGVDKTWNSYVHLSSKMDSDDPTKVASDNNKIFIGQLFSGGNGNYDYESSGASYTKKKGDETVTMQDYNVYLLPRSDDHPENDPVIATISVEIDKYKPELDKTYLDIQGGTIFYAYGGGSNATVREKTVIHVDNPSEVVTAVNVNESTGLEDNVGGKDILTPERIKDQMGVSLALEHKESDDFQIGRLFGGNNLADMTIMPTWKLQSGKIRNLYSGGNRGNMTSPVGLLLEIDPEVPDGLSYNEAQAIKNKLKIDNVYGGCRMADVHPKKDGVGEDETVYNENFNAALGITDPDKMYKFPNELSARVLVRGGDINNVYGGNDVTGNVKGGNAIGIYSTIQGNVYGGGNGAYPYTDNPALKNDESYGDYYYDSTGKTSVQALNDFRPNAEQVSIRLKGFIEEDSETPVVHHTMVKGSVFIGGNCATIDTKKKDYTVELKIGSYVIADKVFLGNNGEGMVADNVLMYYAGEVNKAGELHTKESQTGPWTDYSSLDLTNSTVFKEYMEGVVMDLQPDIVFDSISRGDPVTYVPYTSYVGSFYCGGNVGSMGIGGINKYQITQGLNIFEKFVGGCNNANIVAREGLNAAYEGGVLGSSVERVEDTDGYTHFYDVLEGGEKKIKDRLLINLENLTITPLRWNDEFTQVPTTETTPQYLKDGKLIEGKTYYTTDLRMSEFVAKGDEVPDATHTYYVLTKKGNQPIWNTAKWDDTENDFKSVAFSDVDPDTRLLGGNVYGGCYNSGHVNGNVIININQDVLKKDEVFGVSETVSRPAGRANSKVDFEAQCKDVTLVAMTVFGAGCGEDTEVWGSTTVNLNNGYALQVFGGGEKGMVGKSIGTSEEEDGTYNAATGEFSTNGKKYKFNTAYSSTVNLKGDAFIYSSEGTVEGLAETEYIYGGGNEGDVCGNTYVNLGQGRIYDAFGGAADADILGHTEVYIGRQPNSDGTYMDGFPWIRDIVYGGNDFGGTIRGAYESGFNFTGRVSGWANDKTKIHGYKEGETPEVLKGATYVEYLQGRVDTIFGGSYGNYDYSLQRYKGSKIPHQASSFVNIRPKIHNSQNKIKGVFGAGTGFSGYREGDDSQDRSYVLIDIPDGIANYKEMEIFGAGSYNGLGMSFAPATTFENEWDLDQASAIIDLLRGHIHNAYGGSYNEGITRRTVVNVPEGSTIKADSLYGGAYGTQILPPCDVYESNVNYRTHDDRARVFGAIFGGNNNERRTLYTHVNISAPVLTNDQGYTAIVYGAGRGLDTWAEYTEVNLEDGARVYKVFGGGEDGHVLNAESVQQYMWLYRNGPSHQILAQDPYWKKQTDIWKTGNTELKPSYAERWAKDWKAAWTLGGYYEPAVETWKNYVGNDATYINRVKKRPELESDEKTASLLHGLTYNSYVDYRYNTHVIINKGAVVEGYAYGGGYGKTSVERCGDVYGTTYIALLGGEVKQDIYAAGQTGSVYNLFGAENFTANVNAYIEGGMCRNVYGGGYEGHVGYHEGHISTSYEDDQLAEASVVIGKVGSDDFYDGNPAVTRNAYGGGEGGSVYGTSSITLNNGMIGYRYKNKGSDSAPNYVYEEELDDKKPNDIELAGNVFGGGYVVNSYVDIANVNLYGGTVRGSVYGGGEVGPIGRGTMKNTDSYSTGLENGDARIFKAGQTHVRMYNGHVLRNVFGGGRGKDSWGGDGTMFMKPAVLAVVDLNCKGYVFGQTDVNIYGGEVGTVEGMANSYGNVFGGGDEGSVYSAYELNGTLYIGKKPTGSERYKDEDEGYYYKSNGTAFVDDEGTALGSGAEKILTEDCHVLVEPWLQVKENCSIEYDSKSYSEGDYIPTSYLNTLGKKDKTTGVWPVEWDDLDVGSMNSEGKFIERGVIIHNAVFAGGNLGFGSSEMYANTKTVFGNATATIHDAYNRDLITIGTGHTGGLYGDGNLTFVDGYRELNITNYGTDYYNIKEEIDYDAFLLLPSREQDYYEIKYKCKTECTDNEGTTYKVGSTLPKDELLVLFEGQDGTDGKLEILTAGIEPNSVYWEQNGVVSRYAGRIMNTIQRADFCGVFGSRMVMKGARDRVVNIEDNTNYTINRVREVSLNKKETDVTKQTDEDGNVVTDANGNVVYESPTLAEHGNYFGIYNVVNYLGALTSDVDFYNEIRYTDNKDDKYKEKVNNKEYGVATYAEWKEALSRDPRRNNGLSHNQVALASGVYLELTTEESTGKSLTEKVWGPITGVVELDLINVSNGVGGGFVYAKNIHGVRGETGKTQTLLTEMNKTGGAGSTPAATNKSWKYIETDNTASSTQKYWQTSGNFVHNTQVIIDDCHDESNRYLWDDPKRVPAHKWYIRGTVYVYDRYITATTGNPNAYKEEVALPITISAASHNKMKLLNVQPNLYAYYSSYNASSPTPLQGEQKLVINDVTYELNTPISYWDWYLLPKSEQNLFVKETYLTTAACVVGTGSTKKQLHEGYVMLPEDYDEFWDKAEEVDLTPDDGIDNKEKVVKKVLLDEEGNVVVDESGHYVVVTDKNGQPVYEPFNSVFHSSNDISHTTGYILAHELSNPGLWDTWYTEVNSATHEKTQEKESDTDYEDGPTYHLRSDKIGDKTGILLGQREYNETNIIPEKIYTDYTSLPSTAIPATGQAVFVEAYVVTKECASLTRRYYPGSPVSASEASELGSGNTARAYVCTGSIELSADKYLFINDLLTEGEISQLKSDYPDHADDIVKLVVPAYYCTTGGYYGGTYYAKNVNYRALESFSSMSEADREYLEFNYDALDLLIDPKYSGTEGKKYQYDSNNVDGSSGADANAAHYSLSRPLDYSATYDGTDGTTSMTVRGSAVKVTRLDENQQPKVETVTTIVKGDVLDDEVYESLINEQYHYAPIDVTAAGHYYVVNKPFYYKEPYAVGQVIEKKTYEDLPESEELNLRQYVTDLNFSAAGTYYYCRDQYEIAADGTPVRRVGTDGQLTTETLNAEATVPVGFLISQDGLGQNDSYKYGYRSLVNEQTGFTIHGVTPTETITFFVNREANYDDLTKEKIITVVYQYDYEESDESGLHITPISERHVVRIHINFENGVPVIEDIQEPDLVLPGYKLRMRVPGIDSDEEIIKGGWELYADKKDAESHIKFKDYTPGSEPVYWYEDGFYIAYYAQSFSRKSYSNYVPVHVANYHDLKAVMDDKEKHLYVDYDRTRLQRDSKVYINDYSESGENGLDLLKDFYDLSLLNNPTTDSQTGLISSGTFAGHKPLNNSTESGKNIYDNKTYVKGVRAGKNLEFFLRTDIERGKETVPNPDYDSEDPESPATIEQYKPWTSIGGSDCFAGALHGDGHHLSGLDHSLFGSLCGEVYNLGVSGPFTGAGVAESGSGYVESCWISSSSDEAKTTAPVFGTPSRNAEEKEKMGPFQMVNCYYEEDDDATSKYTNHDAGVDYGIPTRRTSNEFYTGKVAYDLNNFYLYSRYNQKMTSAAENLEKYRYLTIGGDDEPVLSDYQYYAANANLCSSGTNGLRYVEDRFADGDFRFADGNTVTENEHYFVEKVKDENDEDKVISTGWYPIWPDDYIFFGQKLTYGHDATSMTPTAHQDQPAVVARDGGRLSQNADANRVYRAPAYYRSKKMGVAYFNPTVYLAQEEKLSEEQVEATPRKAYPGMTAIDFAGHKEQNEVTGNYTLGTQGTWFYQPLLDDDGLLSIENCDETQNLLVYAPAESATGGYANKKTYDVLNIKFVEPVFNEYYSQPETYRLVADATGQPVSGHLIQSNLQATNDHLLVDKQDFNCPISYSFIDGKRMWYQRKPSDNEYVNLTMGWQAISLPFSAELVTTHQKGEITHFYNGSDESMNNTGTKIGHEYWLREYNGNLQQKKDADNNPVAGVYTADFVYPAVENDGSEILRTKTYTNSFLWDYYYHEMTAPHQKDQNDDTYQTYYKPKDESTHVVQKYQNYAMLTKAIPYIIGLPGQTYYEFDLSGRWEAKTTANPDPDRLDKQVISFVSENTGITIGVSDDETVTKKNDENEVVEAGVTKNGLTFKPNYMRREIPAGTNTYKLNADGNSFDRVPATGDDVVVDAFRPYFIGSPALSRSAEKIVFGRSESIGDEHGDPTKEELNGGLRIWTKKDKIFVESSLKFTEDMRVVTPAGITVAMFSVKPGQTVEVQADFSGLYIVHTLDGLYTKKVTVKR